MKYRVVEASTDKVTSNHKNVNCAVRAAAKYNNQWAEKHHMNWLNNSVVFWYVQQYNESKKTWERIP